MTLKRRNEKRPGKGAFVPFDEWCEMKKRRMKEIQKWSFKYNFYLKKRGLLYYASERDLHEALQSEIEQQELLLEKRRQRARQEAELRKAMRQASFSQREGELRRGEISEEKKHEKEEL